MAFGFVTITSFFLLFVASVFASDFFSCSFVTSTFASHAIITFFVPNFTVFFLNTINVTFFGDFFWWFTSFVVFVDSVSSWESADEWNGNNWVDFDGTLIVGVITIASTAKTESALGVRSSGLFLTLLLTPNALSVFAVLA